jgi:hypothetical protein
MKFAASDKQLWQDLQESGDTLKLSPKCSCRISQHITDALDFTLAVGALSTTPGRPFIDLYPDPWPVQRRMLQTCLMKALPKSA